MAAPYGCHIHTIWPAYGLLIFLLYGIDMTAILFSHIAATLILYSRHMAVQCDFFRVVHAGVKLWTSH